MSQKAQAPLAAEALELQQTGEGPADYSHKLEVNSDYPGAQSVSNREYENRLQDQKRQINILLPKYLGTFEQEFRRLIRK